MQFSLSRGSLGCVLLAVGLLGCSAGGSSRGTSTDMDPAVMGEDAGTTDSADATAGDDSGTVDEEDASAPDATTPDGGTKPPRAGESCELPFELVVPSSGETVRFTGDTTLSRDDVTGRCNSPGVPGTRDQIVAITPEAGTPDGLVLMEAHFMYEDQGIVGAFSFMDECEHEPAEPVCFSLSEQSASFEVADGRTRFMVADAYGEDVGGVFQSGPWFVDARFVARPANDLCENAPTIALTRGDEPTTITGTNLAATHQATSSNAGNQGCQYENRAHPDVFYIVRTDDSVLEGDEVVVSASSDDFSPTLYAFEGGCANQGPDLACSWSPLQTVIRFPAKPNTEYVVVVDGLSSSDENPAAFGGPFELTASVQPGLVQPGSCGDAYELTGTAGSLRLQLSEQSRYLGADYGCNADGPGPDANLTVTIPADATLFLTATADNVDTDVEIYASETCPESGTAACVGFRDAGWDNDETLQWTNSKDYARTYHLVIDEDIRAGTEPTGGVVTVEWRIEP